jgi:hypothetical protein
MLWRQADGSVWCGWLAAMRNGKALFHSDGCDGAAPSRLPRVEQPEAGL